MARAVDEWIGKTDDTPPPPRVKLRILDACGHRCAVCGVELGGARLPEFDHTVAMILGGENRESNLRALCAPCHKPKTAADVAAKAKTDRVRKKHLGIGTGKKALIPGSKGTRFKRKIDGTVVAR